MTRSLWRTFDWNWPSWLRSVLRLERIGNAGRVAALALGTKMQELDNKLIFRQYVLHRLVVLSIYHPARGCNLWARNISHVEQHELLLSARATLKLHLHDDSIWANWDLVMITWAALIVIQAVEGGLGEADGEFRVSSHANNPLSLLTSSSRSHEYPLASRHASSSEWT